MFKWKALAKITAGVLIVGALGYYNFIDKPAAKGARKGDKCPDFTAQIFDKEGDTFFIGERTFTLSQQIGKVCVLNFWETWCPDCIMELPDFDKFYRDYGGEVEVIAMAGADASTTTDSLASWMTGKGWMTRDPNHDWADFALPFAYVSAESCLEMGYANFLPRTIIVDKSGYIAYEKDGVMHYEDLKEIVDSLL